MIQPSTLMNSIRNLVACYRLRSLLVFVATAQSLPMGL